MLVYLENGNSITLTDEPFSSGGEGQVHSVKSAPLQFKDTCVKIYYKKCRTAQRANKIRFMVENPPSQIKGQGFLIGWPISVIVDKNNDFMGFMMYLAPKNSIQLVNLTATKISNKLDPEWHQYYSRENGKFALISRLKLIHNIAIPIHFLHSTNKYVLKDIKPQNLLVTRNGFVTLVDMDSIQICKDNKLLYPGEVLTPMYIPPEYYTRGTGKNLHMALDKSWDDFSLGVVFYQILFGLHPYVVTPKIIKDDSSSEIYENIAKNLFPFGDNKYAIESYPKLHDKFNFLPNSIQSLFKKAFSSNTNIRPDAEEWGKELHLLLKGVVMPPPPPRQRHKVRFLTPEGNVIKELWINHGQCLTKNQIPTLTNSHSGWNKNPDYSIITSDVDFRAVVITLPPPEPHPDDETIWIGIALAAFAIIGIILAIIVS